MPAEGLSTPDQEKTWLLSKLLQQLNVPWALLALLVAGEPGCQRRIVPWGPVPAPLQVRGGRGCPMDQSPGKTPEST